MRRRLQALPNASTNEILRHLAHHPDVLDYAVIESFLSIPKADSFVLLLH
jgi:hypothetical protein